MNIKFLKKFNRFFDKSKLKEAKNPNKNNYRTIYSSLIASLLISSTIIGIRQLGKLQFLEVLAYDFIVQLANKKETDPRLLIVEITDQDIKNQNRWPISDATFAQLLQKLQQHQPKVIGLDVYRDIAYPPGNEELQEEFKNNNIIAIQYLGNNNTAISAPPNIPESRIGFNDVVLDSDNILRRNLMYVQIEDKELYSFSLRLSLAYLQDNSLIKDNPDLQVTSEGIYINDVLINRLKTNSGGYQMHPQEASGWQTLIDYQSPEIVTKVTLTEVLNNQIDPNLVKNKIVLIGTTASSIKDLLDTPYSAKYKSGKYKTIPGVVLHAQMVSQILSIVLDNDHKAQYWFWTETIESLWIITWAIAGAIIAWRLRHPLTTAGGSILALGILWGTGLVLFLNAGWIPVVPPTLSFILTVSAIVTYKVSYTMFYDTLTDLPNRTRFIEKLNHLKKRKNQKSLAIFCLDIDRFRLINKALGDKTGDILLQCAARSLENYFLDSESFIARVGGDEFAVAITNLVDAEIAIKIAEEMSQDIILPFLLRGRPAQTKIAVGVIFSPIIADFEADNLLRAAETAMYKAKAGGKPHAEIFTTKIQEEALSHLELEADLYEAIEKEEFELYYQPIFCLKTNKLAGFEALVRWNSPKRGFVSPGLFIPVAEATSAIIPLGEWILKTACQQMYQWQQEMSDFNSLFISVNLSVGQFEQKNLIESIQNILESTGLAPQNLKLEITESMVMDDVKSAIAILEKLKFLGIKLSMDDFGTGFSSFSYLHRFPMDTLKIDRSFVSNLSKSIKNKEIVSSIIMMAHKLNMDVIAEGIETTEEKNMLQVFNCEYGQGYLFSKPIPSTEIRKLKPITD